MVRGIEAAASLTISNTSRFLFDAVLPFKPANLPSVRQQPSHMFDVPMGRTSLQ
jgi:hypothetical protein